jgi:hypothetical protein
VGCGGTSSTSGTTNPMAGGGERVDPFSPGSIPPTLRGGGGGGTPIGRGGGIPEGLKDDAGTVMNPDEIVFTDPDAEDPDAMVSELRELLAAVPEEGPWRKSHENTFREARQEDKPVLIWFTDSQNSPNCRQLSEELFNRREFEEWASETFVRLQVDRRVGGSKLDDSTARKADYVEHLKKRYKVHGQPTLLVLTPSGDVIGRYKGYRRGEADYRWGQLKQGAKLAREKHKRWKREMEKKGYRHWSDPSGRRIFARLERYREGELLLIEPGGARFQTKEEHLSQKDREWIAEEKRKRGIGLTARD